MGILLPQMILRAFLAALSLACGTALAQEYPAKPVRLLVGFPPGGAVDLVARILQPRLAQAFKREIVVDNRPGASGALAADLTAKAAPDGYTLALTNHASLVIAPAMMRLPYDVAKDFAPVARVVDVQNIFLVHPSLPARDLKELVTLANAKPGTINYATPGSGSVGHLTGELFKRMSSIDWTHVPYRGGAPAMTDFLAGQIQTFVAIVSTAVPYVKQGKVRALAVSGAKRSAALPDVPTVAESGWPEFESSAAYMLVGPARLPQPIIERWHGEIVAVLTAPEIRTALIERGLDPWPSSPSELRAYLRTESAKWAPLVKSLGLTSN
jgi:tripartite-type tricarboxylate transporter receptor subunit TctC